MKKKIIISVLVISIILIFICLNSNIGDLRNIMIDDNEEIENYLSDTGYDYIKDTLANEISFFQVLEKIDVDIDDMIIERFNVSILPNGYIESFNLSFYKSESDDKYMLKYRKREKLFKIVEVKDAKLNENEPTESIKIVEFMDILLTELEDITGYSYLRVIELYSPYETTHIQTGNVYINGELAKEETSSGITFSVYDTYPEKNEGINLYVFKIDE